MSENEDVFGLALEDYYNGLLDAHFDVSSQTIDDEQWAVSEFFLAHDQMSPLTCEALEMCRSTTLDIGACGGSHSLWLQSNGILVDALDVSCGACRVMKSRGLHSVVNSDIFTYETQKRYSTILLLMNGLGIAGSLDNLPRLLRKLSSLLSPDGKILTDITDLAYLYEEEDGSIALPLSDRYYGQIDYVIKYGRATAQYDWLFLGYDVLEDVATQCGLSLTCLQSESRYTSLVCLSKKK